MSSSVAASVGRSARPASPRRLRGAGWPITWLFAAFPLWWTLGLSEFIFLLAAVPMAWSLAHRPRVVVPRGFGWWLAFLAVVVLSGSMLTAEAPFSTNGDLGGSLLTFGYRLAWYVTATIALLYVGNLTEKELPTLRVMRLLAWMFVVTAFGGLLGLLAPNLEFTSAMELVLPSGLAQNPFMNSLIHPGTADIQDVLGFEQARPRAPFAYANSWGANLSFYLPFFCYTWFRRGAGWRRVAGWPVLGVAAVPIVYSLNRALWGALVVGVVYAVIQVVRLRGIAAVRWLVPVTVVALVAIAVSPLPNLVNERFDNPHSNDRRGELAAKTVEATIKGSPLIGFGNTRDVQGNFGSIAGGATLHCPACAVPPFGTQGQLWLVVYTQGLVGTVLFVGFFLVRIRRHLPSRRPTTIVALAVPIFFLVEMFFYDILGAPLFVLMVALGLMWRADRGPDHPPNQAPNHAELPSGVRS